MVAGIFDAGNNRLAVVQAVAEGVLAAVGYQVGPQADLLGVRAVRLLGLSAKKF
jgi:hypothetical protein